MNNWNKRWQHLRKTLNFAFSPDQGEALSFEEQAALTKSMKTDEDVERVFQILTEEEWRKDVRLDSTNIRQEAAVFLLSEVFALILLVYAPTYVPIFLGPCLVSLNAIIKSANKSYPDEEYLEVRKAILMAHKSGDSELVKSLMNAYTQKLRDRIDSIKNPKSKRKATVQEPTAPSPFESRSLGSDR